MSVITLDRDWTTDHDESATLVQMRRRVEQLADALAMARHMGIAESYRQVHAQFSDAGDSDLGQLADLLLGAYHAYRQQRQLDEIRSGRYSADPHYEHVHKDQLRYALCEYNHQLRRFIGRFEQVVPRPELESWLAEFSGGRPQWSYSMVAGEVSELILYRALQEDPRFSDIRFSSIEEDLSGTDIFARAADGQVLEIDVKSGHHFPLIGHRHGSLHLQVSVEHHSWATYELSPAEAKRLRHQIDWAMDHRNSFQAYHRPKHHR
jgi:hypothetical protein